ncbi:MAG: tautomerase family protein [Archaeoglobaceae archaeon]
MPIVQVYVWKGMSLEAKRKLISGITKTFTELGIPSHAVEVLILEIPKEDWGIGGELASEKFREVKQP